MLCAYPEFAEKTETITLRIGNSAIGIWNSEDETWDFTTELNSFGDSLPVTATVKMKGNTSETTLPYMIIPTTDTLSVEEGILYSITFTVIDKPQLRLVVLPLDESLSDAVGETRGFVYLGNKLFGWGSLNNTSGWDHTYYVSFRDGEVIDINAWQGYMDAEDIIHKSEPQTVKIVSASPTVTISDSEIKTVYLQVKSLEDDDTFRYMDISNYDGSFYYCEYGGDYDLDATISQLGTVDKILNYTGGTGQTNPYISTNKSGEMWVSVAAQFSSFDQDLLETNSTGIFEGHTYFKKGYFAYDLDYENSNLIFAELAIFLNKETGELSSVQIRKITNSEALASGDYATTYFMTPSFVVNEE